MAGRFSQRSSAYGHGAAAVRPLGAAAEMGAGILALLAAGVVGLVFVHRPRPNGLDSWVNRQLNANYSSPWSHHLTALGSMPALVLGILVLFGVGLASDWLRAAASASAPLAAVVIVDKVAKPLGMHLGLDRNGTYPSGTVACVIALSVGAVLVAPKIAKLAVAVLGAVATVAVCIAVVVLRWHYPTDAAGGLAVGIGAALAIDGGLHLAWSLVQRTLPASSISVQSADDQAVTPHGPWEAQSRASETNGLR